MSPLSLGFFPWNLNTFPPVPYSDEEQLPPRELISFLGCV